MDALRDACSKGIRELSEWAIATDADAIPRTVMMRAAEVLADDLSVMVGTRDVPEVRRFQARFLQDSGEEATVFAGGARRRSSRAAAAVANAFATDWLELDEGYRRTSCHAGIYVLPALLAEAEATNRTLKEVLRALVLSYEIVTRVARTWTPPTPDMQPHGRYSAVGASAGVALLRMGIAPLLPEVLGTAVTLVAPGPRSHLVEGILSRNVWPAAGAWAGLMAVEWAECEVLGTPSAFYDVYSRIFGCATNPRELCCQLGEQWSVLDGYTKIYGCCQHLHSTVEATLAVRAKLKQHEHLANIKAIHVDTHGLAVALANPNPSTSLGAQFSLPHVVAGVLVTGSADVETFGVRSLESECIARLRNVVTIGRWSSDLAPPNDRPARVTVTLSNGRKLSAECLSALGGPDRPISADMILEKVKRLSSTAYPRMPTIMADILDLSPTRLTQSWKGIVEEMCAPSG